MALTWLCVVTIVLMVMGAPLYACFLGGCAVYFLIDPGLSLMMLPTKLVAAMNSFPFLAIPFFIFAGQIMNRGGITTRIFHFSDTLVGRFRGGLAYVNILASFIFSGMSGSALADLGGLGPIEMKAMTDQGFDEDFSLGITAASSTIGPIVPPSIPFVSYALFSGASLGGLFMAGFMPGIAMVVTLSIMTYIIAKKRNYPKGKKYSLKEIAQSFASSIWALLSPAILIFGIWFGWFTPTEAAMVCVLYSFIVGLFIYHDLKPRDIPGIVLETFRSVIPVTSIVIATVLLAFIVNYEGLTDKIYVFMSGITDNKYVFLMLINIFLIFMGMVADPSAYSVVLIPILAPVAQAYGIHVIHFGVIFVLNEMIGLLTPPVGMSLYLMTTVFKKPFSEVRHAVTPWLIPLYAALIICTYCEDLVMFVPRLMGLG